MVEKVPDEEGMPGVSGLVMEIMRVGRVVEEENTGRNGGDDEEGKPSLESGSQ